ncbi:sensor histidine kinase [Variovorax boronicumulans]|uniref:sensor histidine kinase n=1 Tax=Variovorax boronicumulans TaxID=436515 RepID=UPI0036F2C504
MRIQLMQREQGEAPQEWVNLQSLRDEVDRSTALVGSLLTLARLDPGQPHALAKASVDLPTLISRIDTSTAHARGIRFDSDLRVATAKAHPELLIAALRNLVDNAIRYGVIGGRVLVETRLLQNSVVRIAVRDNGHGVSLADRSRLTERFFRVLGSDEPGSGLGLSIVACIASLHRANLQFEDGIDGRGLSVILDFPA